METKKLVPLTKESEIDSSSNALSIKELIEKNKMVTDAINKVSKNVDGKKTVSIKSIRNILDNLGYKDAFAIPQNSETDPENKRKGA